ncbi:MAG: HTTM domain-containing protein [Acidimicrobiia bacterium]|nr:HTTM domain-containing protein [Acidimicrobiia bacterium]
MTGLGSLDAWLLAAAPATRLAAFRIVAGGFAVVYVVARSPTLWALANRPEESFAPVGVLGWMDRPPAPAVVLVALTLTVMVGLAFVLGWRFALTGPLFAVAMLASATFHSSWGQLLHFENLVVLHVLVIGFSPSADALALRSDPPPPPSYRYGWPLRIAAILTVGVYVIAGVAKLRIGGAEWLFGDSLRNHVAYSAARLDLLGASPSILARTVIDWTWLFPPLAVTAVLIELSAPVALVTRSLRNTWIGAVIVMHLAIAALLLVLFPYQALGFAFAPLFDLEVGAARLHGWIRRVPVTRRWAR